MTNAKELIELVGEQQIPILRVGNILYYSWGYEQTNVDWYQVVKTTGKQVQVQQIEGKEDYDARKMTGTTVPVKGKFVKGSKPMTKAVREFMGDVYLKMPHGGLRLWDGKPKHYSTYG